MKYSEFMTNIRHWDNMVAKWFLRHFYFVFFQIILVIAFLIWFINIFNVIDINVVQHDDPAVFQKAMRSQSINIAIIVFLLILNSFWSLFIFNSINRITTLLRDVSFHLSKMRYKNN